MFKNPGKKVKNLVVILFWIQFALVLCLTVLGIIAAAVFTGSVPMACLAAAAAVVLFFILEFLVYAAALRPYAFGEAVECLTAMRELMEEMNSDTTPISIPSEPGRFPEE